MASTEHLWKPYDFQRKSMKTKGMSKKTDENLSYNDEESENETKKIKKPGLAKTSGFKAKERKIELDKKKRKQRKKQRK